MPTEDKPPFDSPFEWMGGEERVKALAERFYDLMDIEPAYKALRAAHGSTLKDARDKLFCFCAAGWAGPNITPNALAIRACACGTCRSRLVRLNATNGWRAWTKPCRKPRWTRCCANA